MHAVQVDRRDSFNPGMVGDIAPARTEMLSCHRVLVGLGSDAATTVSLAVPITSCLGAVAVESRPAGRRRCGGGR
ncbi:hypothetical protein FHS38_005819 [Streptomyces netropsis]|uniref:Uncharacterized protein n=1 Tax=Streptomyces netropsis TaxID=55404 RepID=A0A7W7PHX4_STRNE|nr:hypothetical protein [Streptomyces netropsis]